MTRKFWLLLAACAAVALTSFLATVWGGPQSASRTSTTAPLSRWLALTTGQQEQIGKDDPTFEADSATLSEAVRAARDTLATMLEAPGTPDAEILMQVDRVADAEHRLQRRITEYVLRIRHRLTNGQQLQLMGLCASGVRGQGYGRGAGGGMGRGPGPHGYRGGRGGQ